MKLLKEKGFKLQQELRNKGVFVGKSQFSRKALSHAVQPSLVEKFEEDQIKTQMLSHAYKLWVHSSVINKVNLHADVISMLYCSTGIVNFSSR